MIIKCGRKEYKLRKGEDQILDNGSCVQLLTQNGTYQGWGNYSCPKLSKKTWKEVKPKCTVFKISKVAKYDCIYYKFEGEK